AFRRPRARHQVEVRPRRMAHAHVAEAVDHALARQDMVRGDEFVEQQVEAVHAEGPAGRGGGPSRRFSPAARIRYKHPATMQPWQAGAACPRDREPGWTRTFSSSAPARSGSRLPLRSPATG